MNNEDLAFEEIMDYFSEENIEKALGLFVFDDQEEAANRLAEKALRKYQSKSHKEQLQKVSIMKNTVTLVGFVGNTPEVRTAQSGTGPRCIRLSSA